MELSHIRLLLAAIKQEKPGSDWRLTEENDGIRVYQRRRPGSDFVGFKGETVIDAPIRDVFSLLFSKDHRKKWVDRLVEIEFLQCESPESFIEYYRVELPFPFQSRDFINRINIEVSDKTGDICSHTYSVNEAFSRELSGVVRGRVIEANAILKPISKSTTWISLDVLADPGGYLPPVIVNLIQQSWPRNTLTKLRDLIGNLQGELDYSLFDSLMSKKK